MSCDLCALSRESPQALRRSRVFSEEKQMDDYVLTAERIGRIMSSMVRTIALQGLKSSIAVRA